MDGLDARCRNSGVTSSGRARPRRARAARRRARGSRCPRRSRASCPGRPASRARQNDHSTQRSPASVGPPSAPRVARDACAPGRLPRRARTRSFRRLRGARSARRSIAVAFRPHRAGYARARPCGSRSSTPITRPSSPSTTARRPELGARPYDEQLAALLPLVRHLRRVLAQPERARARGDRAVVNCLQLQPPGRRSTADRHARPAGGCAADRLGVAGALALPPPRRARADRGVRPGGRLLPGPLVLPPRRAATRCGATGRLVVGQIASRRSRASSSCVAFDLITTLVPALRRRASARRDRRRVPQDRVRRARARAGCGPGRRPGRADAARPHAVSFVGGLDPTRPRRGRCAARAALGACADSSSGATAPTARPDSPMASASRRGLGPGHVRGARALADLAQPSHRRRRGTTPTTCGCSRRPASARCC